jgi:hypothetical protein
MFLAYVNCSSSNSTSIIISVVTDCTVYAQLRTWSIHCFYGIHVFYGCNMWYLLCSVISILYYYNSTFLSRCAVPSGVVPFFRDVIYRYVHVFY